MIAGSYTKSVFHFVRNHQAILQSGCIILRSHHQWMRVPVAMHPWYCQFCWIFAKWIGRWWYFIIILICNSVRTNDLSIYSICLFSTCIFSLVSCLFSYSTHVLTELVSYWVLRVLCLFWIQVLVQLCILQTFAPNLWLIFSFS